MVPPTKAPGRDILTGASSGETARLINAVLDARAAGFDNPADYATWQRLDGSRTLRLLMARRGITGADGPVSASGPSAQGGLS
jgi:hypothetical protein